MKRKSNKLIILSTVGVLIIISIIFFLIPKSKKFPEEVPVNMDLYIGGYFGYSFYLICHDNKCEYKVVGAERSFTKKTDINLKSSDIVKFVKELNALGVYSWKDNYTADVQDGTRWHVKLEFKNRQFKSSGHNKYPSNSFVYKVDKIIDFDTQKSDLFKKYLKSVESLIGNKSFGYTFPAQKNTERKNRRKIGVIH